MDTKTDVIFVDHSILSTGVCGEKQRLQYIEHLVPIGESTPLVFGSAWHAAVAYLYTHSQVKLDEKIAGAQRAFLDYLKENAPSALPIASDLSDRNEKRTVERGFAMIDAYARKWAHNDIYWSDIVNSEGEPFVEIGFSIYFMDWHGVPVMFVGKIDRIRKYRIDGMAYNWETKTTSWGVKRYAETVRPNHQYTGYTWASKELLSLELAGNMLDAAFVSDRKIGGKFPTGVDPENDFGRYETRRSPTDVDEFLYDLKLATTNYLTLRDKLQSGELRRAHRQTAACTMYGGCYYREACGSNLNPAIMRNKYTVKRWHPWENDQKPKKILEKKHESQGQA
jgi:hypothetical protein